MKGQVDFVVAVVIAFGVMIFLLSQVTYYLMQPPDNSKLPAEAPETPKHISQPTGGSGITPPTKTADEKQITENSNQQMLLDSDSDAVLDQYDNCPSIYNPDQTDANGNGVGNACETNETQINPEFISPKNNGKISGVYKITSISQQKVSEAYYEYSNDGFSWIRIGSSAEENSGFPVNWDTKNLNKGGYFLRVSMTNNQRQEFATIGIVVDNQQPSSSSNGNQPFVTNSNQ